MSRSIEYEATLRIRLFSTLDQDQLTRQLVVALWEGMDESIVIPDGETDALHVIEYEQTTVEEVI